MTKDDDEHTRSEFNRNIEKMNGKDKWQIILNVAYGVIPSYSALFSSFVIFWRFCSTNAFYIEKNVRVIQD